MIFCVEYVTILRFHGCFPICSSLKWICNVWSPADYFLPQFYTNRLNLHYSLYFCNQSINIDVISLFSHSVHLSRVLRVTWLATGRSHELKRAERAFNFTPLIEAAEQAVTAIKSDGGLFWKSMVWTSRAMQSINQSNLHFNTVKKIIISVQYKINHIITSNNNIYL